MLPQILQLPLVEYCSSIDFSTTKHSSTTVFHSSCCHNFYNCHWLLNFQPANTNHSPLIAHPANSPYLTSSIHTATTSKHNSCCHDFYNCHWLLNFQPANTTGIDNSKYNEINNMHWLHPLHFVLQFPLPLGSIFDTAIDNEIHNSFHISCCISHCH